MSELSGFDAAYCPKNPPQADVVAFYGPGGDQLNVWTQQEIEAQPARFRLPIFVRSNPLQASAYADAGNFLAWLRQINAPPCAVVLDLETAVAPSYVTAFGGVVKGAGYDILPYGSSSTLFKNPVLDGYFVALPGATSIPSNCVAVQYGQGGGGAWDLDLFSSTIKLWDTAPSQEEEMPYAVLNSKGTGYIIATDLSHKTGVPDSADWTTLVATKNYQAETFTDALINNIPGS
jgi:hypothetical protein